MKKCIIFCSTLLFIYCANHEVKITLRNQSDDTDITLYLESETQNYELYAAVSPDPNIGDETTDEMMVEPNIYHWESYKKPYGSILVDSGTIEIDHDMRYLYDDRWGLVSEWIDD
jgi:hypothetical protein